MELRLRLTRGRVALVALMVGLVTAGVAYATIPDGNGVFTACRLNATGTIRLIDSGAPSSSLLSHCTTYETAFTFNQKGDPGKDGKDGLNGTNGTNGTNGAPGPTYSAGAGLNLLGTTFSIPSEGVDSDKIKNHTITANDIASGVTLPGHGAFAGNLGVTLTGTAETTVATLTLSSAGTYLIFGKTTLYTQGTTPSYAQCRLSSHSLTSEVTLDTSIANATNNGAGGLLSLLGHVTADSGTAIEMKCRPEFGTTSVADTTHLAAVEIAGP